MAVLASDQIALVALVDIKSFIRFYKLQNSTLPAPGVPSDFAAPGWSTIEPGYTEGSTDTLYTVERVTFSDDTFKFLDVQVSSSYEAAKIAYNKAVAATTAAAAAQDTADAAIKTSVNEYALHTSETVAPTTGWSTTAPARTAGSFIWFRTVTTKGDGTSNTSSPALLTGNTGATGAAAKSVSLTATTQVLTSPATGGATTPATSVVTGTALNTTITAWTYSTNGAAFVATLPTGVARSGNVVTITGATMTARTISVKMADAGGVADTLTVAKALDGAVGTPGADAYTVLLTNESHTFAGTTTSAAAGSTTTGVVALKGIASQNVTVGTITGQVTGLTTGVTGSGTPTPVITVTVTTALVTQSGQLTIPLTVDGKSFTKYFSWSVAYKGTTGTTGTTGTSVSSITPYYLVQPTGEATPATPGNVATPPIDPVGSQAWVTTEPTWQSGTAMWRTDRIAFINPSSYAYTTPSRVSSYDAATSAANMATTADKRVTTAIAAPLPADATGRPEGAVWYVKTASGMDSMWVLVGSAWVKTPITQNFIGENSIGSAQIINAAIGTAQIADASITNQLIVDGAITAKHVEGEKFEGLDFWSPSAEKVNDGVRAHVGDSKFEIIRTDSEGREVPTITMGGASVDQLQLFDTSGNAIAGFDEVGAAVAKSLTLADGDLVVGGVDVMYHILTRLPRGILQSIRYQSGSFPRFNANEVGLFEMGCLMYWDRLYRISGSWTMWCASNTRIMIRLRFNVSAAGDTDPASPTIAPTASTVLRQWYVYLPASQWVTFYAEELYRGQYSAYIGRFVFTAMSDGGNYETQIPVSSTSPVVGLIEDIGLVNGSAQNDGTTTTAGGTASNSVVNVPPTTSKKTYTSVWEANNIRVWRGNALVSDTLQYGSYGGVTRYSLAMFTAGAVSGQTGVTIYNALSGSTGVTLEMWIEPLSWYAGAGGKFYIGRYDSGSDTPPNTSTPPASVTSAAAVTTSATYPAGVGRWVPLPSSWATQFAGTSRTARGLTLGQGSGTTHYGKARYGSSNIKLRAQYTK